MSSFGFKKLLWLLCLYMQEENAEF